MTSLLSSIIRRIFFTSTQCLSYQRRIKILRITRSNCEPFTTWVVSRSRLLWCDVFSFPSFHSVLPCLFRLFTHIYRTLFIHFFRAEVILYFYLSMRNEKISQEYCDSFASRCYLGSGIYFFDTGKIKSLFCKMCELQIRVSCTSRHGFTCAFQSPHATRHTFTSSSNAVFKSFNDLESCICI